MFKVYLIKFYNVLRFFFYNIINIIINLSPYQITSKTLLIIRLDSIGDYLLVRNYLRLFKSSKKYCDYKITLCGNIVWKDLAETFDADVIDDFIWLDRKKFNNNLFYKYKLLKQIHHKGFEVVIDTTFSREILYGDSIVKTSRAKERIGSSGSPDSYVKWKRNLISNRFYTKLIQHSTNNLFEFYRNKEFFGQIFEEPNNISQPKMSVENIQMKLPTKNDYIVIFPGAQEKKRMWPEENFKIIIKEILNKYSFDIIIAGSNNEKEIAERLLENLYKERVFDLTGRTTLPELAKLISLSKLLISNETSAVHFAASVGTKFICVSNGNHYGRFNPYPKEMNVMGKYIYPPEIQNKINDFENLSNKYRFYSDLDINSISPETVIITLSQILLNDFL